MRGSPEDMWGVGGSGPEGGGRASGRGGFGQGVGPPAFPWKRRGVSAKGGRAELEAEFGLEQKGV